MLSCCRVLSQCRPIFVSTYKVGLLPFYLKLNYVLELELKFKLDYLLAKFILKVELGCVLRFNLKFQLQFFAYVQHQFFYLLREYLVSFFFAQLIFSYILFALNRRLELFSYNFYCYFSIIFCLQDTRTQTGTSPHLPCG